MWNFEAITSLIETISFSRVCEEDSATGVGKPMPKKKGYSYIPLDDLRQSMLLPAKRFVDGRWKKYTTSECVKMLKELNIPNFEKVVDICIDKSRYERDVCFAKLNTSYEQAYELLGLKKKEKDIIAYRDYLRRRNKRKQGEVGFDLYSLQKSNLKKIFKRRSNLDEEVLEEYILDKTSFADTRVFHPITSWSKADRRKYLPYESDLKACTVNFLSKLIKEFSGRSPLTDLIDTCRKNGKDVYIEIAKRSGQGNLARPEAKEFVTRYLFNGSMNWVIEDEGYQGMLAAMKKTDDYNNWFEEKWEGHYNKHKNYFDFEYIKIKFDKLYVRKCLQQLELGFMTIVAKYLMRYDLTWVSIHDCFAFRDKPSVLVKKTLDSLAEDFGCKFSHE